MYRECVWSQITRRISSNEYLQISFIKIRNEKEKKL
jgi:hypothetical protein